MNIIDLNTSIGNLEAFLTTIGWLNIDEKVVQISSPGEGNMNVVLRIHTNLRTFILKQSRSYVRKYPDLAAPLERIHTEYQWYKSINYDNVVSFTPKVLNYSQDEHLLMLEDIGESQDLGLLYHRREISNEDLEQLTLALSTIHSCTIPDKYPDNLPLRKLNHQHVFVLPLMEENGFQLDSVQEGLQALSLTYKQDEELKAKVSELGVLYLSEGTTLLHGDYYPGSWLRAKDEIFIIDPEFSFLGFAEFDLGVLAAHLILITGDSCYIPMICEMYDGDCNYNLVQQFAGVEIIRRIIGLAQLSLVRTLEEKNQLLQLARDLVTD